MVSKSLPDPGSAPVDSEKKSPLVSTEINRAALLKTGAVLAAGIGLGAKARPVSASPAIQVSPSPVTIRFAGVKTNGTQPWPSLIAAFEKQNPTIKVEFIPMQSFSESTSNHEFLVTNLASGSGQMDVLTGDVIWVPEFYGAGWLLSPAQYMTKSDLAGYYPGAVNAVSYLGKLAGVPWFVDGGMLYYRKDLLSKYHFTAPTTYDQLVHQCQVILQGERSANPNLMGFLWQAAQAEVLVCDWVEFLGAFGGSVLNARGLPSMNTPQATAALTFLHDLIYKYKISPPAVTSMVEEPSRIPFTQGNAIFLRNWSYVYGIAQDPTQSKVVNKVGVVPLPRGAGGHSTSNEGGFQYMIAKSTKHPAESVALAKFLSSLESQVYFATNNGFSPTRPAVLADPRVQQAQPFLVKLRSIFEHLSPRPVSGKYPQMSLALQADLSAALSNALPVNQALSDVQLRLEQITGQI
ncbi:MAG TPA: ABC transporter substrate-binding protein [Chloroflexota bacterium]|nr:ABC transporter substrate-binding protein [Chloroflexota bacterium]